MEPTIYKPSIYKGTGIYKAGAEGGGGGGGGGDTADIDGKSYKVKKIGELVWTTENIKVDTTNAEIYNDEYYYRLQYLSEITNKLSDGWRVPSQSDFRKLLDSFVKSDSVPFWSWCGYILKSNDWTGLQGALQGFDPVGFGGKQKGYLQNGFLSEPNLCLFATTTGEYKLSLRVDLNGCYLSDSDYISSQNAYTIRLCKDA